MTDPGRSLATAAGPHPWAIRDGNGQTVGRFPSLDAAFRAQVIRANGGQPTTLWFEHPKRGWLPHPVERST